MGTIVSKDARRKELLHDFTDDHSHKTHLDLLSHKCGVFDAYKVYEARLKTQKGISIKALWSDRGGEYITNNFSDHLKQASTFHHLMAHNSLAQNGVAEHLN